MSLDLMDADGPKNSTIFVLGATGCGKTTLIANLLKERPRFVIFDTREEYDPEFFGNHCKVVSTTRELIDALNLPSEQIIIRLPPGREESGDPIINSWCYTLIEFQRLNKSNFPPLTVGMDELNRFVTPQSSPNGLKEIIQRGRGHNIQKIFGAQWFNSIPTWTRDTFTEIYVFRHSDPNGLRMLENYGVDSGMVATLPPYTVLHTNPTGEISIYKLQAK